jgi:hypothetical protein
MVEVTVYAATECVDRLHIEKVNIGVGGGSIAKHPVGGIDLLCDAGEWVLILEKHGPAEDLARKALSVSPGSGIRVPDGAVPARRNLEQGEHNDGCGRPEEAVLDYTPHPVSSS